jgi:hypothetical protein
MKRLVIAAAVAAAVLFGASGEAKANGGYGFGFGVGVNVSFSGWTFNPCGGCGSCSTCCCVIPGWSPEYAPPTMYGGLQALLAQGCYPGYGGYPHAAVYPGGGTLPPPASNGETKKIEQAPGKQIEK